jgi:hypothetical protein
VRMFYYSDLWNLCSFSIEEEVSCEAQSCIGALCRRVKILTFQVTAYIGLLKEGGKIKSLKNCPGQAPNLVKVRIFGCFSESNPERSGFWCVAKARSNYPI